ncbi:MAG: hypothetical protein FJ088_04935 [Deltaproteobacteria bacterium]|nr:hypothetical protein [Deltaproteobacteria bacterium]
MGKLAKDIERYLGETLALPVTAEPWKDAVRLPLFLREEYDFYLATLMGVRCLLMAAKREEEPTPAVVRKQMSRLLEKWDGEAIYVRSEVSSHNRKRLIEHNVPFIVPGKQMYLPMLGIDLREHFRRRREKRRSFSPSTQALMLHVIYSGEQLPLTPTESAKKTGYSVMTMTRAFDELERAGIGEQTVQGKERFLEFPIKGRELWNQAKPYMKTPVRRRMYAVESGVKRQRILAGFSALARYTKLAEPDIRVFAVADNEWKAGRGDERTAAAGFNEPGNMEIELWSYNPALFARDGLADRLSLFLSLMEIRDERVEAALDEMMEGMNW